LFGEGELVESVADILFDRKMREQGQRLKDIGQFAALRWERESAGSVEETFFAQADFPRVGLLQAGDAIEQRGFSRAGRAEQDGEARRESCSDIEEERLPGVRAELFADLNAQHSEVYFASHGDQTRRFTP